MKGRPQVTQVFAGRSAFDLARAIGTFPAGAVGRKKAIELVQRPFDNSRAGEGGQPAEARTALPDGDEGIPAGDQRAIALADPESLQRGIAVDIAGDVAIDVVQENTALPTALIGFHLVDADRAEPVIIGDDDIGFHARQARAGMAAGKCGAVTQIPLPLCGEG